LDIKEVGLVGGSGGGPIVMAVCWLRDSLVKKAVTFVCPASPSIIADARKYGIISGSDTMGATNQAEFAALANQTTFTEEYKRALARLALGDRYALLNHIMPDLPQSDRDFLAIPEHRERIASSHWAAFQEGGGFEGIYQDNMGMRIGDPTFAADYQQFQATYNHSGPLILPASRSQWNSFYSTEYGFYPARVSTKLGKKTWKLLGRTRPFHE